MTAMRWIRTVLAIIININNNYGDPFKKKMHADVERESNICDIRLVAMAANQLVEDSAGKLLNMMSKSDTTFRLARLAMESCLRANAMVLTIAFDLTWLGVHLP